MLNFEQNSVEQPANAAHIAERLRDTAASFTKNPSAARGQLAEIILMIDRFDRRIKIGAGARSLAPWQARRITVFIDEHLEETIRVEQMAAIARLSASYFFRAFRGTFGMAPHAFVVQRRTERAKQLLAESDQPIASIAAECGFADQAHLSRLFARHMGYPPGEWRRQQRLHQAEFEEEAD